MTPPKNSSPRNIKPKDFLPVFASTGHESLKALLLVSGGAVVTLLAFLGTVLASPEAAASFGSMSIEHFLWSLSLFITSVGLCLVTFALIFWSHSFYYEDRDSLGRGFTYAASISGLLCIGVILWGGYTAVAGLNASEAASITRSDARQTMPSP